MQLYLLDHAGDGLTGMVHEHAGAAADGDMLHDFVLHPFVHAVEHSLYMLPVLIVVFLIIGFIEKRAMGRVRAALSNHGFGVVGGALLGLFPQCGFSVAASNLFAERLISAGTLAAVFIATSDEALPIIMANPGSAGWFLPLLAVKFGWAIAAGFAIDGIFRLTRLDRIVTADEEAEFIPFSPVCDCEDCGCGCESPGIVWPAIKRALGIFSFIVITSFLLNIAIELLGEDRLSALLMTDSLIQPLIAATIGLIPNCAASVVLSNLFVSGVLGFGSLAAGLCSGAGLGMLVLFRVNRSAKQNFAILGCVWGMSVLLGVILELIL